MILNAYGDSWTIGQGCDRKIEDNLTTEEKIEFQKNHSWPKILSDKIGCEFINHGISGNSNNKIFNTVISDVKENRVTEKDLVIIMWSSSLRDPVPFLPSGEWVTWSVKHMLQEPYKFLNSYTSENIKFDSFFTEYKKLFISDLFNQNFYNIVNQYYIIFLQRLLEYFGIRYVMCDSFENMVIDLRKEDNLTSFINKSSYWEFDKKTFRSYLIEKGRIDIWEYQDPNFESRATQHPNYSGYKIIAEEIHNFVLKNKIL